MVLLGICTPVQEDSHCTAAELVYGTTLCLPCQFFSASSSHTDPTSYVHSASSLLGSSFMLHLSVLIIALFTFPTASPHVHMSLSDMMPPASLLNIRDGRYKVLKRRPKHCTLDTATQLLSPWIVSSLHIWNHSSLQHQLHHHPTYSLPLCQAQPSQHLHHELHTSDDIFTGLIAFITERWLSLWWESICDYSTQRHTMLYFQLASVPAILASM